MHWLKQTLPLAVLNFRFLGELHREISGHKLGPETSHPGSLQSLQTTPRHNLADKSYLEHTLLLQEDYRRFRRTCGEDEGNTSLLNVGGLPSDYTAQPPRGRPSSDATP